MKLLDLTVNDLLKLKGTSLENVVEYVDQLWSDDSSERRNSTRCATAFISNNEDGLGEIRIVFRFPFESINEI